MMSEHVPAASSADDARVTLKGRYRILGPGIARGEAVSYAAENVASQQPIALVVLRGETASDADFVAAVREQAYRLAKPACHHRTLIRVYDTGTTDEGEPFVALEPVVGRSLREVLDERGALGPHEGLRLAIEIGEGLETLHRSGILHGELRPESVVLVKAEAGGESVKLVGVELTAARRTPAGVRIRDESVGAYLAPEQIAQAETTEASDVHGLGLLILELLTGQRPNGNGRRTVAEIPPALGRIVAKAIEPGPGRRYSSISLMVNDLWSAESEPSTSRERAERSAPALGARRPRGARRTRSDVGMATALVVGLLLVGVTAWVARSDRFLRTAPSPSTEPAVAASPVTPTPDPASAPLVPVAPTSPTTAEPAAMAPATSASQPETIVLPAAPASPAIETEAVRPALPPAVDATKRATVGAVRAPRPALRQPERAARADQPSADGGDGTAIIDWLLKGGRSGD